MATCLICSQSSWVEILSTLVNRQLATSCQLGFLILLCCMYFEWSAYKLAGYFFCALSTVNKPLNLFFKLFRSGLCHQYRIYVVVSQMSFCGETSDTNTKFWLFSHKFIVWNHKMISAILLLLKSCFCVLYGSHIHHYLMYHSKLGTRVEYYYKHF